MHNKIVIINSFKSNNHKIDYFAKAYDSGVAESGKISDLFYVDNLVFSATPFPEKHSFESLESDLRELVLAIKSASTIIFFTNYTPKQPNHQLRSLINRLFHTVNLGFNENIWGKYISLHKQQVRIVTYMDDLKTSIAYNEHRDSSTFPIQKVPFRFFGFGRIRALHLRVILEQGFSKTLLKEMALLHEFGRQDAGLPANKPSSEKMKLLFDKPGAFQSIKPASTVRRKRIQK
ncbi:hypothetical protein [Pedobacter sp. MW01-1-1]|uniref:hypothetical protein n=1 Tax=Pedobacter sp. MW01-1-1 TaxID=3383027 RepID=UPI003FF00DE4